MKASQTSQSHKKIHVMTAVLQAAGESALASESKASQHGARVFPVYLLPWAAAPPSPPLLASALPPSDPLAAGLQASAPQVSVLPSVRLQVSAPRVSAPQVSAPQVSALPAAAVLRVSALPVAALLQVSAALVAVLPSSALLAASLLAVAAAPAAPAARLYTKPQAPSHLAVSYPNTLPPPTSATL